MQYSRGRCLLKYSNIWRRRHLPTETVEVNGRRMTMQDALAMWVIEKEPISPLPTEWIWWEWHQNLLLSVIEVKKQIGGIEKNNLQRKMVH